MGLEHAVLLGRGQPGVQRQDLQVAQVLAVGQRVGGVPDLPLAAEEDQDVPGPLGAELRERVDDALDLVLRLVGRVVRVGERPVAHLDRVGPPGHLDDRRTPALIARFASGTLLGRFASGTLLGRFASGTLLGRFASGKMLAEALRVDRGRGDDDLEVRAGGQQPLQVAENEVDVQAALVRLVDDQRVVAAQLPVPLHLGQQDAVGHHLDLGAVAGLVGEPHLVADRRADLGAQFLGDAFGYGAGRDPPGLGVADLAGDTAAKLQADLRQLGRLPRAGLARDDDDLVVADRRGYLVLSLADREFRRIRNLKRGRQGGSLYGSTGNTHQDGRGFPRVPNTFPARLLPRRRPVAQALVRFLAARMIWVAT